MSAPVLQVDGLVAGYEPGVPIVRGASIRVERGEIVVVLGPNGAGKSSFIKAIAGLVPVSAGTVLLDGTDITAEPAHRRPINMMFQSYALFPHMSVARNVAYGLDRLGRAERARRVETLLKLVRLDGFGERRPDTLSGGQRQRVALARALARDPHVLVADEPTSMLDASLRADLLALLRRLARDRGLGILFITHDLASAAAIADRVVVLYKGKIVEEGPVDRTLRHPTHAYTRQLMAAARHDAPAAPTGSARAAAPLPPSNRTMELETNEALS